VANAQFGFIAIEIVSHGRNEALRLNAGIDSFERAATTVRAFVQSGSTSIIASVDHDAILCL
jgi:hypothetical protein